MKYLFTLLFIGTIFLANWMIANVGYNCYPCVIPVGFGLYAPSGVLAIGLGFVFRDLVQEYGGVKWTILAIITGAILSAWINPFLALASGSAFLFSELMDLAVYTPLRKNHIVWAMAGSNLVGLVADSVIFLGIAFGSMEFLAGQIIGKLWMTVIAVPVIMLMRKIKK